MYFTPVWTSYSFKWIKAMDHVQTRTHAHRERRRGRKRGERETESDSITQTESIDLVKLNNEFLLSNMSGDNYFLILNYLTKIMQF